MDQKTILKQTISERHSVRAFLDKPVDQAVLEEVFHLAGKAPSSCNTQPWLVHVVSGGVLEKLRHSLPEALQAGQFAMDFPYTGNYPGIYRDRQHEAAKILYDALGIERSDRAARDVAFLENFRFFGAPHAAFFFMAEGFGLREACDVGMYAQTLMLSLQAYGIGSCPQTALSFNAPLIRESLTIKDSRQLLFGISFGYEDKGAASNQARTDRAILTDLVTFHS